MQCVNTTVLIVDTEISKQILYIEQEHVNNPNWWEDDQLAIYFTKRGRVESGATERKSV